MQNRSVLVISRLQLNPPQKMTPARKTADNPIRGYMKIALSEAIHILDNHLAGANDHRLKTLCSPLAIPLTHMLAAEIAATVAMDLLPDPATVAEPGDVDNESLRICCGRV